MIILATNSIGRFELLKSILKKIKIKYIILEKVVFLNRASFINTFKLIRNHNIKNVWVNCIRREVKFYQLLKKKINNQKFIINFTGNKWGIASNLIHFIDLFFFFRIPKK